MTDKSEVETKLKNEWMRSCIENVYLNEERLDNRYSKKMKIKMFDMRNQFERRINETSQYGC